MSKGLILHLAAILGLLAIPATSAAQEHLRVSNGEVSVLCPLTIGGSFEATTNDVSGKVVINAEDAAALGGEILVDLQALETGIGLRNKHLKENYLEVDRGADFAAARLGDIRVERLRGKTVFRGTLMLHGQRREVTGSAAIEPHGAGYRVEASFPVRVADFQIAKPAYLGVGVKDEVVVRVKLRAERTPVGTLTRN